MRLVLNVTKPPLTEINPNTINITLPGSVSVEIIGSPNETVQVAFVLGVVSLSTVILISIHSYSMLTKPGSSYYVSPPFPSYRQFMLMFMCQCMPKAVNRS